MTSETCTVTVDVPVTFHLSIAYPAGSEVDVTAASRAMARVAAEHFVHVSSPQINAFNEVNRLHPHGKGQIAAVSASIHPVS